MIICLETSTPLCSVALCDKSGVIETRESKEGKSHAAKLTVFIEELLLNAGLSVKDLEAVVVSKGPGSYTGLRIGVSVAKGMAYAASIPLIGIETPLSMFYGITESIKKRYGADKTTLYCPMLDARRMEVYYALFDARGNIVREISAETIDKNSFTQISDQVKILFFGDGCAKYRDIIQRKNIDFVDEFRISAASMQKPAYKAIGEHNFEDVAYFEPYYLKDFITSRPVKNILGT